MLRKLGIDKKTVVSKKPPKGNHNQLHHHIATSLSAGDLRQAVKLPPDEDIDEWLAINVIDFFNGINLLYGGISEFCTAKSCPTMNAGAQYEYLWADGIKVKKPIKVSAPEYVELLMVWIQSLMEDNTVFPTDADQPFPKKYKEIVKTIMKRLFRVYAHIYYNHATDITNLGIEAHMNTSFSHFYLFIREFDLMDSKELVPLQSVIDKVDEKYPRVDKPRPPSRIIPRANFATMLVKDKSQIVSMANENRNDNFEKPSQQQQNANEIPATQNTTTSSESRTQV